MSEIVRIHTLVFSTLVEVFLQLFLFLIMPPCLLHARGGVSIDGYACDDDKESSPRSWRCFFLLLIYHLSYLVFSTLVEVFLKPTT